MSNLILFPTAKAPAGGMFEAAPDGVLVGNKLVDYAAAIRQLDEGTFDNSLADGLRLLAEIYQGSANGWFKSSEGQAVTCWRWLVACLFVTEQLQQHGTIEATKEDGTTESAAVYRGEHGGMVIYPSTERFALANNVEGLALEHFGADANSKAVMMYQSMTEKGQCGEFALSDYGRELMAMLHDEFINVLNAEGIPPTPTAH